MVDCKRSDHYNTWLEDDKKPDVVKIVNMEYRILLIYCGPSLSFLKINPVTELEYTEFEYLA